MFRGIICLLLLRYKRKSLSVENTTAPSFCSGIRTRQAFAKLIGVSL